MEENFLVLAGSGDGDDIIDETNPAELVDEVLVEAIWSDLEGRVDREQILKTALHVAENFADATVTTFIPLFIRRRTYEQLKLLVE